MIEPVYLLVKLTPGSVARARQAIHDRVPVVSDAVFLNTYAADYRVLKQILDDCLVRAKAEAAKQEHSQPTWRYEERPGDSDHITLIVGDLRYRIRKSKI